jgi:demethylmenaquinone methyltransferase/2-methoxy-6-polyprenyl-1,4-benzoquinol methylase
MSFGGHRLWKDFACAASGVRSGDRVLDVAAGSADMSARFARRVGSQGRVIATDINPAMLDRGRARLLDRGIAGNVDFVLADAEKLPFAEDSFHCVSIAFGLRNVTRLAAALESMCSVLMPGGRALVLEFSRPRSSVVGAAYDAWSFAVIPRLGRVVAGDEDSYRYLVESIRRHPDQERLRLMMVVAGFDEVVVHNLAGGIVALHVGYRY